MERSDSAGRKYTSHYNAITRNFNRRKSIQKSKASGGMGRSHGGFVWVPIDSYSRIDELSKFFARIFNLGDV
jgi:hypothetical protein